MREEQYASREQLRRLLGAWHAPEGTGTTWYLPPGQPPSGGGVVPDEAWTAIERSSTGAVVFWSPTAAYVVLPPFPLQSTLACPGWDTGPLRELLDRPRRIGVLLLRLGRFAVGIYEDGRLVVAKTGSRLVHGRHRKGGSSSARFARRRAGQAQALFDAACETLCRRVEEYPHALDHLLLGGQRETLLAFRRACPFTERVAGILLERLLNVREPSRKELEGLPRLLYQSRILAYRPEGQGEGSA